MRKILITLCLLLASRSAFADSTVAAFTAESNLENGSYNTLSGLISYQTNGPTGIRALVPEVFLGVDVKLNGNSSPLRLRLGPTISTYSVSADSSDQLRALTLPGTLSLDALLYRQANNPDSQYDLKVGVGLGLKAIASDVDTISTLLQQGIRLEASLELKGTFLVGVQYTWGSHNITDESAAAFADQFGRDDTSVQYISVAIQTKLSIENATLFAAWRQVTSPENFPGRSGARKSLMLGIRKSIDGNKTGLAARLN